MNEDQKAIADTRSEAAMQMHDALMEVAERLIEGVTVEMPPAEQVERLDAARKFSQVAYSFFTEMMELSAKQEEHR